MENKLLLEGGVGGHMNHPYDNDELTFGQLKDLLRSAVAGELRGTEKTDGQNLFISFDIDSQKAKAIRNKTQIKAGGLTPEQLDDFFSEHPAQALRYSFVEALQAFEEFARQLPKKTQLEIFGPSGDIYFNTEIMNPGTPGFEKGDPRGQGTQNVVPYDKKTLLIHGVGHAELDRKTGNPTDTNVSSNYKALEQALEGKQVEDPRVFSIETHPTRELAPSGLEKASRILPKTLAAIDNVMNDAGATEDTPLVNFVVEQAKADVNAAVPGLDEERLEALALKFLNLCKRSDGEGYLRCNDKKNAASMVPNENIRNLLVGLSGDAIENIKTLKNNMKEGAYRRPIALALSDFTNAILDGFDSAFIADNEKQKNVLRSQLRKVMKQIAKSDNEAAKEGLRGELEKLKSIENVNTPTEGFVFKYNGDVYKFTGAFAPMNQILGMPKFQRYGEIAPMETIAVFPGSFKPPHRGHLEVVKAISQNADKTLVIVSRPMKSQRTLPLSGKIIGSTEAINLMRAMLEGTGLEDKVEVISGVDASPMMTTIKYVTFPADEENPLVAPKNAEVILGVGEKGDDAKRYSGLPAKVQETRPDLDLETTPTPAVSHDKKYLSLLQSEEYSDILERMPSQISGAGIQLFHASDMRFLMDLAAQDLRAVNLLADFVGGIEKVPSVLDAVGIVPATQTSPEEDQVEEPELEGPPEDEVNPEDLAEIVFEETMKVVEAFKSQKAPKAGPSKGKFQRKMRQRLSKAHATYLDMGRKDLTKHGGGFRMDRKKDVSNAFLAEEELDEMSSMAGGNCVGFAGPIGQEAYKRKDKKMNNEEQRLRRKIRIGLKEFFASKAKEHEDSVAAILEEHQLRMQLRDIILEQSLNEAEDPTVDVHDNTGINTLKDLMKNTNVLSTLREVYKTLTTDENQKKSFRAHIIKWVEDTLAPVKLNDAGADGINEEVGVDIEGVNDDMFIDAADGSEKDQPEVGDEENTMQAISGEDTTGRNKAERVYPTIEKSIIDYYAELDNPEDQEMFYDYLIANLKLYFDKWDSEMSSGVEEPTNDEYEAAKQAI
jgi:cytidyltransferase-like protein